MPRLRVLLLTLGDTEYEQQRLDGAVIRLDREYKVKLELEVWSAGFYPRDPGFEAQLREADWDLILGIFRVALPVELPAAPERMSDGSLYPSNSPYEVLAAVAARRQGGLPPAHIFRHPAPADEPSAAEPSFKITFHDFVSTDDFEDQVTGMLRGFVPEHAAAPVAADGEEAVVVPPIVEPMVPPAALVTPVAPVERREWAAAAVPAEAPAPPPPARRYRLGLVAAAIFALVAIVAWSQVIAARHTERATAASLAAAEQRVADAEGRAAATAHTLEEATRGIEAARRRLKLADNLVVAMVQQLSEVLRTTSGLPAETVRQIVHRIEARIAGLLAESGNEPDIAVAHAGILGQFAQVYAAIGDAAEARKLAEQAVAMLRPLVAREGTNDEWQRDLGVSLRIAGSAALRAGDSDEAAKDFEESVGITRRLAGGKPPSAPQQRELMSALTGLGDTKIRRGDPAGALPLYEEAAAIVRRLSDAEPDSPEWTRGVAVLMSKVGDAKARTGDREGALVAFQQALVVQREVAAAAPDDPERQRYIAIILGRIGDLREESGDTVGALGNDDESLTIRRALATKEPNNRQAQVDLAIGLYKVAGVSSGEQRRKALQEALAILQRLEREAKLSDDQTALASAVRQALAKR